MFSHHRLINRKEFLLNQKFDLQEHLQDLFEKDPENRIEIDDTVKALETVNRGLRQIDELEERLNNAPAEGDQAEAEQADDQAAEAAPPFPAIQIFQGGGPVQNTGIQIAPPALTGTRRRRGNQQPAQIPMIFEMLAPLLQEAGLYPDQQEDDEEQELDENGNPIERDEENEVPEEDRARLIRTRRRGRLGRRRQAAPQEDDNSDASRRSLDYPYHSDSESDSEEENNNNEIHIHNRPSGYSIRMRRVPSHLRRMMSQNIYNTMFNAQSMNDFVEQLAAVMGGAGETEFDRYAELSRLCERLGNQNVPLEKGYLDQIPIQKFDDLVNANPNLKDQKCSVCITSYEPEDQVRYLPCEHVYHPDCIEQWFQTHPTCPICSKDMRDFLSDPKNVEEKDNSAELIEELD